MHLCLFGAYVDSPLQVSHMDLSMHIHAQCYPPCIASCEGKAFPLAGSRAGLNLGLVLWEPAAALLEWQEILECRTTPIFSFYSLLGNISLLLLRVCCDDLQLISVSQIEETRPSC